MLRSTYYKYEWIQSGFLWNHSSQPPHNEFIITIKLFIKEASWDIQTSYVGNTVHALNHKNSSGSDEEFDKDRFNLIKACVSSNSSVHTRQGKGLETEKNIPQDKWCALLTTSLLIEELTYPEFKNSLWLSNLDYFGNVHLATSHYQATVQTWSNFKGTNKPSLISDELLETSHLNTKIARKNEIMTYAVM